MNKAAMALDWALYYAIKPLPAVYMSNFGALMSAFPRRAFPAADRDAKALFAALRPEWRDDPAALDAAARRLWTNVARVYGEVPKSHRLASDGSVTIANVERLDAAMASDKPVIALFVHTGNWEVAGIQLANRFPQRAMAIYDPPKRQSHAQIVLHERRKMPADLVPLSRLVWRQALNRLRRPDGALWVPADEFAFHRVNAPFFGRPPRTDGNLGKIARLALKCGAIVVPFYNERHPRLRFTTHILPQMTFEGDEADHGAVMAAVQAIDAVLTPKIIGLIDQWYMALFYRDFAALPPEV